MGELVRSSSLREFFKLLVEQGIREHRLQVGEGTEFYLVNLLSEFASSENLFTEEENGRKSHESLALLYHRARQEGRDQQIRTLRRLGDVSLYKAGFFSDALRGKAVGPDYYIDMGGAAYEQVASLAYPSTGADIYRELGEKFKAFVEVLEEISARGLVAAGATGTLKVYETWVRTKNNRLEKVLVDAGVVIPKGMVN